MAVSLRHVALMGAAAAVVFVAAEGVLANSLEGANVAFVHGLSERLTLDNAGLPSLVAVSLFVGILGMWLFEALFVPYRKVMTIEDIENHKVLSGLGSNYGGRSRKPGDTPPPYPNGWYKVMDSRALKSEPVNMQFVGQHLVAFRGESGTPYIIDAYCPHLGANLGSGGKVKGENIECPFHGWQFEGKEGKCAHIPYSPAAPPEQANSRAWHCCETNGHLYMWFDAEGRPPLWEVLHTKEIDSGEWYFHGSSEHDVKAHIQEMPENGADVAHLNFLHTPLATHSKFLQQLLNHKWKAEWAPGKGDQAHMGLMDLEEVVTFFGWRIPFTTVNVKVVQQGPGLVFLNYYTPFGRCIVMETVTPMKPLLQRACHMIYSEWMMPRFVAKIILAATILQFERDVPIWNNKTFLPKPVVVKGDGPIPAFRRWYRQFYSESSDKYRGNVGPDW